MNSSRQLLFGLLILVLGILAISTYQFLGKPTPTVVGEAEAEPEATPKSEEQVLTVATAAEQEVAPAEATAPPAPAATEPVTGEPVAEDTVDETEPVMVQNDPGSENVEATSSTPDSATEERLYNAVAELESRLQGYIDDAVNRAAEQAKTPTADELGEEVAARVLASIRDEQAGQSDVDRLNLLTATEPPATIAADEGPQKLQEVHFLHDSSELTPGAQRKVNEAAEWYRANTPSKIRVVGFSDTRGTADYNLALSQRRADSVASLLIRAGIPAEKLEVEGMGEVSLPEPTDDNVAEPLNRCVGILAIH